MRVASVYRTSRLDPDLVGATGGRPADAPESGSVHPAPPAMPSCGRPPVAPTKGSRVAATLLARVAAALAVGALAALLSPLSASAMSVSPIHVEMATVGNTSRAQIVVANDGTEPLPVEASLDAIALDEAGNAKHSQAGEQFLVFPPQALIPPGGTQVFRVQWVGEPDLQKSESYMLSLTQIPVKLPKGQSAVQVVMSFGVMINVAPAEGQPQMSLVSTGVVKGKDGKRHPVITVANSSNVHGLLERSIIHLSGAGWQASYQGEEISQKIGIGLVQPGHKRKFVLPDVLPAGVDSIQATLDYKQK